MPFTGREVLELFVECVDEVLGSSYLKQARSGGVGSSIAMMKGIGVVMGRSGPDRDSVKSALLTVRLFCQNNEATSLQNVEALILRLPIAPELKDRFAASRRNFNELLSHRPSVSFPAGIGADTNNDVFDTMLYGEFAHFNPEKRRRFKMWENQPCFKDLQSQFDLTLLNFVSCVAVMRSIVLEVIAQGVV